MLYLRIASIYEMARAKRSSFKQTADTRLYCRTANDAIPHLHSLLNQKDLIFISLDIEGRRTVGNSRIDEIGIAILDTRHLGANPELIISRHICTRYRDTSFLFGDSERCGNRSIPTLIKSLFYIEDINYSVSPRSSCDNDAKLTSLRHN